MQRQEYLASGEKVVSTYDNITITDKRIIKTNGTTHFEDLNLSAIEAVQLDVNHYDILLRVGVSFGILFTLFEVLKTVAFLQFIPFQMLSGFSIAIAVAFLVGYFVVSDRVTKVYGANKTMTIHHHDWDIVHMLRKHQTTQTSKPKSASGRSK